MLASGWARRPSRLRRWSSLRERLAEACDEGVLLAGDALVVGPVEDVVLTDLVHDAGHAERALDSAAVGGEASLACRRLAVDGQQPVVEDLRCVRCLGGGGHGDATGDERGVVS